MTVNVESVEGVGNVESALSNDGFIESPYLYRGDNIAAAKKAGLDWDDRDMCWKRGDCQDGGAKKDHVVEGKPQLSLIPMNLMQHVARAFEYGIVKYRPRNNFRAGFLQNVSLDAVLRHVSKYFDEGQIYDADAWEKAGLKVHHLGMAVFGLLCMIDAHYNHPELARFFVPENWESAVPLSVEEAEMVAQLQKKWASE